jgi:alpha-D-xyloside xylohydrolase
MPTYDLPTFLNEPSAPVELVSELESYALEDSSVILRCKTLRYTPVMQNYYGTLVETILQPPTPGTPAVIRLDFCSDSIVRLRYAVGDTVPDNPSPMLVRAFDGEPVEVEESERLITVRTRWLRVEIVREPLQIRIFNRTGEKIWETRALDIDGLRRPEFQWNPGEQRWIFYHRYAYPLGHMNYGDRQRAFISLDLRHDEHLYGLGEDYGRLDKRNTFHALWNQEGFGNASPAAYKKIPFYMSTRGYGMFIHTANAVRVRAGDLEHTALSAIVDDSTALDLFIIAGMTFANILGRYTSITGAPALPPKWTFGLWMARISYNRQQQVEAIAAALRERAIPCDVIHIDTDWYKNDWECDLEFSDEKFPDPAGMMARLREQGFRVSLWQWPQYRHHLQHVCRSAGRRLSGKAPERAALSLPRLHARRGLYRLQQSRSSGVDSGEVSQAIRAGRGGDQGRFWRRRAAECRASQRRQCGNAQRLSAALQESHLGCHRRNAGRRQSDALGASGVGRLAALSHSLVGRWCRPL